MRGKQAKRAKETEQKDLCEEGKTLQSLKRSVAFALSEESRHFAAATGAKGGKVRHDKKTLTQANTTISQRRNTFSKIHSTADFSVPKIPGCIEIKR